MCVYTVVLYSIGYNYLLIQNLIFTGHNSEAYCHCQRRHPRHPRHRHRRHPHPP